MVGYELQKLEKIGAALRGTVRFERADGRVKVATYGWPADITRQQVEATLEKFFQDFLGEPTQVAPVAEVMTLVGQPADLSHLDPAATAPAAAPSEAANPQPPAAGA